MNGKIHAQSVNNFDHAYFVSSIDQWQFLRGFS